MGLVDFAEVSDPVKLSDLFAKPHHIHSLRPAFDALHMPAPDLAPTNMHAALDELLAHSLLHSPLEPGCELLCLSNMQP